jgi:hypothetical protein
LSLFRGLKAVTAHRPEFGRIDPDEGQPRMKGRIDRTSHCRQARNAGIAYISKIQPKPEGYGVEKRWFNVVFMARTRRNPGAGRVA